MDIKEVRESLKLKFTSGNSVPVNRASLTKEEYDIICTELSRLEEALSNASDSISLLTESRGVEDRVLSLAKDYARFENSLAFTGTKGPDTLQAKQLIQAVNALDELL